uniref:MFS domain-containing protein n=1 Tax=Macrostomum lignano TaxID=282301 RepID=A0A1I8GA98_9PLAT
WLVLAGAFSVYFVCEGIENSFGLVSAEIIQQLGASRQSIGWIVSLKCACMFFVCPLSALVCRLVDVRLVGAAAGCLTFLGFFAASFASQTWHLFLTVGMVTGPGVGTCFLICMVTICTYFDRLRATASGIALCGSGLGTGEGTLLLSSAIYLHTVPCCLLMRPLQPQPEQQADQSRSSRRLRPASRVLNGDSPISRHNPGSRRCGDCRVAATNGANGSVSSAGWLLHTTRCSCPACPPLPFPSLTTPKSEPRQRPAAATTVCRQLRRRCRNPALLAFHASRFLLASAAPAFFAYTADRCLHLGFGQGRAAALLAVLSACSMAGRLGFGCLGDRGLASPLAIYGLALLAGGCLVGASLAAKGFAALAACLGAAWCFVGGAVSLTTLITVYLDGTRRLFYVFARQSIFQGFGVLLGPPLAGAVFDKTGSYNATFMLIGASLATSGLLVLGIYLLLPARTVG